MSIVDEKPFKYSFGMSYLENWFAFTVVERLNIIETEQKLIFNDLQKANEFIVGVPKGNMVSPQINELFMLVEFISSNQEKLKKVLRKRYRNK